MQAKGCILEAVGTGYEKCFVNTYIRHSALFRERSAIASKLPPQKAVSQITVCDLVLAICIDL